MQTTLLIMAAGIGSRFGGGIKQLRCWRTVHIREIYSLICKACSHGKPWLLCYLAKTQLTFLAHFVILKLHIWESSLTVRLSNPHMKK